MYKLLAPRIHLTRRQEQRYIFHQMAVDTIILTSACFGMMLQYMISEMKEAGISPNAQTYSLLMDGYAMVNQPRKASQVMQNCIDDGHKVISADVEFVLVFSCLLVCLSVCCQDLAEQLPLGSAAHDHCLCTQRMFFLFTSSTKVLSVVFTVFMMLEVATKSPHTFVV